MLRVLALILPTFLASTVSALEPEPGGADTAGSPLSRLLERERQIYGHESRGRDREALELALEVLDDAATAWHDEPDPLEKEFIAAKGVALVFLVDVLSASAGLPDPSLEALNRLRRRLPDGMWKGRIEASLLTLSRRSRTSPLSPETVQEIRDRGGFLRDWCVIGPFDNERGSGFHRAEPPEKGFDPEATPQGKLHPVRWRRLPVEPEEVIDFAALFAPREQCLAYALTSVWMEEATDVAIRLGSDEGVKLWVNDVELLARDVRRPIRLDQDAVGVRLPAGWNRILLKVTQREDRWGFSLRLTRPDGSPLQGFRVDARPEHLASLEYPRGEAPTVPVDAGVMEWLTRRVARNEEDSATHHLLAFLHMVLHPEDEGELSAYRHAIRAFELDRENINALYLAALTSRRRVKMKPEVEENKKRTLLEQVITRDPEHVQAHLQLARYYMTSLDNPRRSRESIRAARGLGADDGAGLEGEVEREPVPAAEVFHIQWLRRRGFSAQADAVLDDLARMPERVSASPKVRVELAERAARSRRYDRAVELCSEVYDRNLADVAVRVRLVEFLQRSGRSEEALAVCRDAVERNPFDLAARLTAHEILQHHERFEESEALLREVLEICPQSARFHAVAGDFYQNAGRRDRAREAYTRSLELDSNNSSVRRYLDFLDQTDIEFHDAFPRDVEAIARRAADVAAETNEPYRYLLRRDVIKVNADGRALRYQQVLVKILTERGIREFDIYPVTHAVGEQEVRVLTNRIFHPDGEITLGSTRARSLPGAGASGSRDDRRFKRSYVDFPPLAVGDVVEIAYRLDDRRQSFFGDYFGMEFLFQETDLLPVDESTLILIAPGDRELHFHRVNGAPEGKIVSKTDEATVYRFSMTSLPGTALESHMPPMTEVVPILQVSTYESWDQFASWWWNLIRKESQVDPDLERVIREESRRFSGTEGHVSSFYDFVARDIRYVAWEFGVHGYQPYNASTILARRFGDCKDKSILFNTMLGEVGVESFPVLVYSGNVARSQDLTLPLVNHFNHCISYVPGLDGEGRFLDGTAEFSAANELPGGDRGRLSLVIRDGAAEVREIPEMRPEQNQTVREAQVLLSLSEGSRVQGRFSATGDFASRARARYRNPDKNPNVLESMFANRFGPTRVSSSFFPDLTDFSKEVDFSFDLTVEGMVRESGGELIVDAVQFPVDFSAYTGAAKRRFGLILPTPFRRLEETTLVLPDSADWATIPEGIEMREAFGSYALRFEKRGERELHVSRDLSMSRRRIAASEYPAFRAFALQVAQGEERRIRLRRRKAE